MVVTWCLTVLFVDRLAYPRPPQQLRSSWSSGSLELALKSTGVAVS